MPKIDSTDYRSIQEYQEALQAFHGISVAILFGFAEHQKGNRNIIICNFIARTDMISRSIFQLWELQDYQDCWVLFRCLLDRLFHLHYLRDTDQFDAFEAWSFLEQAHAQSRVRGLPDYKISKEKSLFNLADDQKLRLIDLEKNPPKFMRPKAEDVAKKMRLEPLYDFGYDFASTQVHPMANDGLQDFYSITKLTPSLLFPDQRSVLSNTLLVGTLILQEGLNACTLSWRSIVYDFLDNLRSFLDNGDVHYKITFIKISKLLEAKESLCQPA